MCRVVKFVAKFCLDLQGVSKSVDYSVEDHLIVGHLSRRHLQRDDRS